MATSHPSMAAMISVRIRESVDTMGDAIFSFVFLPHWLLPLAHVLPLMLLSHFSFTTMISLSSASLFYFSVSVDACTALNTLRSLYCERLLEQGLPFLFTVLLWACFCTHLIEDKASAILVKEHACSLFLHHILDGLLHELKCRSLSS